MNVTRTTLLQNLLKSILQVIINMGQLSFAESFKQFNFYHFQGWITWKFLLFLKVQQLGHKLYILIKKKKKKIKTKNIGNVTRVYTSHPHETKKKLQTEKYKDTTS